MVLFYFASEELRRVWVYYQSLESNHRDHCRSFRRAISTLPTRPRPCRKGRNTDHIAWRGQRGWSFTILSHGLSESGSRNSARHRNQPFSTAFAPLNLFPSRHHVPTTYQNIQMRPFWKPQTHVLSDFIDKRRPTVRSSFDRSADHWSPLQPMRACRNGPERSGPERRGPERSGPERRCNGYDCRLEAEQVMIHFLKSISQEHGNRR